MDGLYTLEEEFDYLPLEEAPPRPPQQAVSSPKDDDAIIVLDSTPPPAAAATRTPTKVRKVVAVDITGDEPKRQIIELTDLPIQRPSLPKPAATPSPISSRTSSMSATTSNSASRSASILQICHPLAPAPAPAPPARANSATPVTPAAQLVPSSAPSVARPPLPPPSAPVQPQSQATSPRRTVTILADLYPASPPPYTSPKPAPSPVIRSHASSKAGAAALARAGLGPPVELAPAAPAQRVGSMSAVLLGSEDSSVVSGRKRGGYVCRQCGQPKKGHVCTADPSAMPLKKSKPSKAASVAASSLAIYNPPPPAAPTPPAAAAPLARAHIAPRLVPAAAAAAAAVPPQDDEERLLPFKPKATKAIVERIDRAITQKLHLIARKSVSDVEGVFNVLGSIGNVYEVKICQQPSCNCPDFEKGNFCKHILFIYLKVLRVSASSYMIYQRALLKSELKAIFAAAPKDPAKSVIADDAVRRKFKELSGDVVEVGRKPLGDFCPVCYEQLKQTQQLLWCRFSCGNNIHADCFREWSKTRHAQNAPPTCVYCRAAWPENGHRPAPPMIGEEGYVNLGSLQRGMRTDRPEHHSWRDNYY